MSEQNEPIGGPTTCPPPPPESAAETLAKMKRLHFHWLEAAHLYDGLVDVFTKMAALTDDEGGTMGKLAEENRERAAEALKIVKTIDQAIEGAAAGMN
jgi:hypothetical protein